MNQESVDKIDQRMQTLLNKTDTGYIEIDITGRIYDTNVAYCNMLGASLPSEIIGRSLFEWTNLAYLKANSLAIIQCAEHGRINKLICQYQTFKGKNITVSLDAYAEKEKGSIRIYGICHNITQQILENEATSKKQYQLETALDAAKAGMFSYNFKEDITFWDQRSYKIFNVDPDNFQTNYAAWLALIHPKDVKKIELDFQAAIAKKNNFELEYRIVTTQGIRYINVKARMVRDKDGEPILCHGLHQDVTEANKTKKLLHAKQALEKSQINVLKQAKLLRSIIDSIPDLIFYKDLDGQYLGCNKAFEEFSNINETRLIGKNDIALFDKEQATFFRDKDTNFSGADETKIYEEWVTYPNGKKVLLEALKTPFIGINNKVVGLLGISRNITERKNAENKYQALTNENNIIFDSIPVGVAYIKDRHFFRINQYWIDLFGWSEQEIIDKTSKINYFYKYDFIVERKKAYPSMLKGDVYRSERFMVHKNGSAIWCQLSGQLIDINIPEKGSIWIVNDINKEKNLRDSLRLAKESSDQLKDMAEKANKAKSEFLANMSHELRTPMHAILSFSNFGLKKIKSHEYEKLERYFSHINTSGKRLLNLLNDLLDLSKLEAGKMDLVFNYSQINEIINSCIDEQQTRLEEKKVSIIKNNFECGYGAQMDSVKIGQVITNLISNAIKFTPEGGKIYFTISKQNIQLGVPLKAVSALKVEICDDGVSIPENELKLVFNKFIQSSKTSVNSGGIGLGLSICQEIIKGHQGIIWADNRPRRGAIFSFAIPINRI
ncbi:MAG: PAS domain S-box protein [Methylococcales bacterium]|nr:PAS domain S-box protein [Methylococcales bacterium]